MEQGLDVRIIQGLPGHRSLKTTHSLPAHDAEHPAVGAGGGERPDGRSLTDRGRPMLEVADVFRLYGDAYLQKFGRAMPPSHRRALDDIRHCRTEVLGGHVYGCDRCGHRQYAYHSCKNHSCPKCQEDETEVWIERRRRNCWPFPISTWFSPCRRNCARSSVVIKRRFTAC